MKTNIIKYQFEFELINTNMLVNSAFLLERERERERERETQTYTYLSKYNKRNFFYKKFPYLLPTFIAGIVLNFTILGDISLCIYLVQ